MDAQVAASVPDAQSAPNFNPIGTQDFGADLPDPIPLTQSDTRDHPVQQPSGSRAQCEEGLGASNEFVDHPEQPLSGSRGQCEEGLRASNEFEDDPDQQPYERATAVDSDDDRPVPELTDSDVEMLRRIFPGRRNPRVHEFSDLTGSDQAFPEGRDDELLEAPEVGPYMAIEEGRVYKDLPALKRWLQYFAVICKRPYKVLHLYVERHYIVVCDKQGCPWRVCARKQKAAGKWKITKVVGPHTCADHDLNTKHRQLTSTIIAKELLKILKSEPNMKVRRIMETVEAVFMLCGLTIRMNICHQKTTSSCLFGLIT